MTELVLRVLLVIRLMICLRYLSFIIQLSRRRIKNSVRIVMSANVIKASISLFLVLIRVLVLGLMKVTLGPTVVLMLLLLARIVVAYHFTLVEVF